MSTRSDILKYALLPGILPRLLAFFRSGFMHLSYMIAVIYGNVRLLPTDHPYLQPQNIGRFGLRHVLAEAANHLVFSRKNIDQIIIYFTILGGMVLLIVQFILLITAIWAQQPAFALGVTDLFPNPNAATGSLGPDQDIAFIILDRVFGLKGFFNSCISDLSVDCEDLQGKALTSTPTTYPFPFHTALQRLLQFYTYGIFWVGATVIIYLFIAIVAETAQTGTPFGQRFNKAWAPVRLILFFALIVPLNWAGGPNQGLNGAQLITFKIVQLGSNMATNAWSVFNGGGTATSSLSANYMSQQYDIVAQPEIPEVNDLIQAIFIAQTCASAYHIRKGPSHKIDAYLIRPPVPTRIITTVNGMTTPAPPTPDAKRLAGTPYSAAVDFTYKGNIIVRFGHRAPVDPKNAGQMHPEYKSYTGNIKPYCGDITLQIQGIEEPGANSIYNKYYEMLGSLWDDKGLKDAAKCLAEKTASPNQGASCSTWPATDGFDGAISYYRDEVEMNVQNAIKEQRANGDYNVPDEIIERGWGGAAIWYNRIAAMNGAVTTAALNLPKLTRIPLLMELVMNANRQENQYVDMSNVFSQNMADQLGMNVLVNIGDDDREILKAMEKAHNFWVKGDGRQSSFTRTTDNIVIDFINSALGTSGLFEMRENTDVHPLAQLTALGKGLMEATLRNAAYAAVLGGAGGLGIKMDRFSGEAAKAAGGFFMALTMTTLGISVVLYYVLPFLPFIYFIFAVSGWIKSIFEAIVAMPLWALAHLRIDGEGIVGPGASQGYFLLLEIFLRPVLIVFGFVASISIFSALVSVLNQIFDLVVANLGGFNEEMEANIASGAVTKFVSNLNLSRGPIDEFFYTAIYAIICYLMGLACFKLVDLIPNNILRWMGASVSTFQENAGDPAGQLSSNVYKGTLLVGNQARGMTRGDFFTLTA